MFQKFRQISKQLKAIFSKVQFLKSAFSQIETLYPLVM